MHRIWVSAWQFDCCGDAFDVGSDVRLTVVEPDVEWLSEVLGPEEARRVTASEEHHGGSTKEVVGRVVAIEGVTVEYAARGAESRVLYPVEGSARRVPSDSVPAETDDERHSRVTSSTSGSAPKCRPGSETRIERWRTATRSAEGFGDGSTPPRRSCCLGRSWPLPLVDATGRCPCAPALRKRPGRSRPSSSDARKIEMAWLVTSPSSVTLRHSPWTCGPSEAESHH